MTDHSADRPRAKRAFTPIAVVGVSALFPGSLDKTGFWRDILAGKDLLKDIPETHWLIDDYYDADPTKPGDNQGFAVFGRVVEGMDVVKRIMSAPTSPTEGVGVMKGQMIAAPIRIATARRAEPKP